jgi:two-component system, chemotaxis family, sensor kinase Cph1
VGLRGDEVVDLTHAVLRSISPIHLQYMKNMGVTASLGISLIHEGRLWGLITCNHESGQRFIPHQARSACALLGEIVSSLIGEKQRLLESEQRVAFLRTQAQLVQFIAQERDVVRGLTQHVPSLPEVTRSSAAAICNEQGIHRVGNAPGEPAIAELLKWLVQRGATAFVADSLPELYPAAHAWKDVGCGLLAVRVDCGTGSIAIQPSWLLWFRPEVAQTVAWGGDPNKPVLSGESSGPLHPRTSFELWKEDVHLKSTPFRAEDAAAAQSLASALGHVILEIEVNRQVSQKALLLAESNRHLRDQIAETERVEVELRRAQKLEAVGRLAAGVAHEINTPLQFVGDSVRFLGDATNELISLVSSLEPSTGAREAADFDYLELEVPKAVTRSIEGIKRVSAIVQAMKEFARPDGAEKVLADINHALTVTVEVAQGELNKVAAVALDLGTLPMMACYLGDLNQVFLSLLVNAAHAIEPTLNATRERGLISVKSWYAAPDVWVSVTDDGVGIPESNRERVFLPFFTTQPVGRGTGQGLAIAHAIVVNKHGGSLGFESEPGKGTTFTVRLPVVLPAGGDNADTSVLAN